MLVKATAGLKVPMEGKPHDYITETDVVEVQDSAYYQRRISDGDLLNVPLPNPLPVPARGITAEYGSKAARTGVTGEGAIAKNTKTL